jgi:hypothetical protein
MRIKIKNFRGKPREYTADFIYFELKDDLVFRLFNGDEEININFNKIKQLWSKEEEDERQ